MNNIAKRRLKELERKYTCQKDYIGKIHSLHEAAKQEVWKKIYKIGKEFGNSEDDIDELIENEIEYKELTEEERKEKAKRKKEDDEYNRDIIKQKKIDIKKQSRAILHREKVKGSVGDNGYDKGFGKDNQDESDDKSEEDDESDEDDENVENDKGRQGPDRRNNRRVDKYNSSFDKDQPSSVSYQKVVNGRPGEIVDLGKVIGNVANTAMDVLKDVQKNAMDGKQSGGRRIKSNTNTKNRMKRVKNKIGGAGDTAPDATVPTADATPDPNAPAAEGVATDATPDPNAPAAEGVATDPAATDGNLDPNATDGNLDPNAPIDPNAPVAPAAEGAATDADASKSGFLSRWGNKLKSAVSSGSNNATSQGSNSTSQISNATGSAPTAYSMSTDQNQNQNNVAPIPEKKQQKRAEFIKKHRNAIKVIAFFVRRKNESKRDMENCLLEEEEYP
jgi:hypothetical protein